MKQDKLKNPIKNVTGVDNKKKIIGPTYLVYFFLPMLEQVLKKVVEKSILKLGIQFPLQLLALKSQVFCTLWFLFVKFCMLGREVVV